MKWIKKTYLQCIPLRFGVCLSFYRFFLALLRNHCRSNSGYAYAIKRDFEMLYLRYFSTNHFQTSQHLLNLRAVFPASRRIYFPWRVHEQSLKKKDWKRLLHVKLLPRGLSFFLLNLNANLSASIISQSPRSLRFTLVRTGLKLKVRKLI